MLSSDALLTALRGLRDDGRTTNAAIGRLLALPSSRIAEIFDGKRKIKVDEAKKLVDHFGLGQARSTSDHQPTRSSDAGDIVEIVQLDLSLSMGPGTLIEDFVESEVVGFDASLLSRITRTPADRLRFVTGIGNSHAPVFQHADQFLIDINERKLSRLDAYYWITFDGAHALKRLRPLGNGLVQIVSENPSYDPMDVSAKDVRIEGRAVWFARGL